MATTRTPSQWAAHVDLSLDTLRHGEWVVLLPQGWNTMSPLDEPPHD